MGSAAGSKSGIVECSVKELNDEETTIENNHRDWKVSNKST